MYPRSRRASTRSARYRSSASDSRSAVSGPKDARHRRVDDVEQDQLAGLGLGLGQAQGPVEDLGVGRIVLQRHADPRQRPGPSASPQSSFTLGWGSQAGDAPHERLDRHPDQQRGRSASHAVENRATSQLNGIGPTCAVHSAAQLTHSPIWSRTSLPLKATMIAAVVQARTFPHQGVANSPMFCRFDVKWISGITANESCKLRITWLRISRRLS